MRKRKKNYRNIIIKLVVVSFIAFSFIPIKKNSVEAEEKANINIKNLAYYNLIVFNNCTMTDSRIEGALAVGNNINIEAGGQGNPEVCGFISKGADAGTSLVIGKNKNLSPVESPLDEDTINPALLLGGKVDISGSGKKLNAWSNKECPIVTKASEVNNIKGEIVVNDQARDFESKPDTQINNSFGIFKKNTEDYIGKVNGLKGESIGSKFKIFNSHWAEVLSDIKLAKNIVKDRNKSEDQTETIFTNIKSDNGELIIKAGVIPDAIGSAKEGASGNNALKNLVIVSDAEVVDFSDANWSYNSKYLVKNTDMSNNMLTVTPKNKTVKRLSQHITWVFPNAKEIKKNRGDILGSVIAPKATLDISGGNIVGQVIVNNMNQKNAGEFCSLLDVESLTLKNKTVLYGDKVDLEELLGNCMLDENILNGYRFKWSEDGSNKVVCKGKVVKEGNKITFKEDSGFSRVINPKDTRNYTLEITNNLDTSIMLKAKSNIRVLKPEIVINKEISKSNSNKDQIFSFNLSENYKGNIPVFINSQKWNGDVSVKNPIKIINVTRGDYSLFERDTAGYKLKKVTVNGEEFNLKKDTFKIGQNGNSVTLNGKLLKGNNPIIKINVVNNFVNMDFYHSNDTLRNNF